MRLFLMINSHMIYQICNCEFILNLTHYPLCCFFNFFAEELRNAKENPAAAAGIGLAAGLLLMRGITYALIIFLIYNVPLL